MNQSMANRVLAASTAEQERDGYIHTLREIRQQPSTLLETCERMLARADDLKRCLEGVRSIVFTGSGSSEYAGSCVQLPIQQQLALTTQTVPSGGVLTHGTRALAPLRPALAVSLARSGDSPESVGAVQLLLDTDQDVRHIAITCNKSGKLATFYREDPRVSIVALDERTNDQSLVMTSSFTSLAIAARALGYVTAPGAYRTLCRKLSSVFEHLINTHFDTLQSAVEQHFSRAVFLGSGSNSGAAHESALKMLEMTAGRVSTLAETYLGLRHGPMSYLDRDSLVVCFLSSDSTARLYESDLIRELDRKELSRFKIIVGERIPPDLLCENDIAIECPDLWTLGSEDACLVHVVAGQLLAFFRCLKEGLRPDSPSESGVINRVVESFRLHI
jgi:tagatose-6-phosphate ketose/aldose isomerase